MHTLTHAHMHAHHTHMPPSLKINWQTYQQTSEQNIISIVLGSSIGLSVRCRGHSNLVNFNQIFSKFRIIIKLSFKFENSFFSVKR